MLIRNGLEYDSEGKFWVSTYPWINDPYLVPNNYSVANAQLNSLLKRLAKSGTDQLKAYAEQINDMLERGVARKLSRQEILHYKGPIHYLPHFGVLKDSDSTPLRIVLNASSPFAGTTLNNFWSPGVDCLNSLPGILLRFREGFYAFIGDVKKMYNSVRISELDQHCHRFLWKEPMSEG